MSITVKVLMLTAEGVVEAQVELPDTADVEHLLTAQKNARKSRLLQFAQLRVGTADEWEVLFTLPTPIFANGVQVA